MDVNNTERPNNLKVVSSGISLKGWTVLHHILRDYSKTEAMPQKKEKKKKAMESTSSKRSQEKEQYKLLRKKAWIKLPPSPFKAVAWNQI